MVLIGTSPNSRTAELDLVSCHVADETLGVQQEECCKAWIETQKGWMIVVISSIPSGYLLHSHGKSPFLIGKPSISMGHFPWLC